MISVNLFVPDSKKAFEYYKQVFDARLVTSNFEQQLGYNNCLFTIGNDNFALADENIEWGSKSAITLGQAPLCIQLYLDDINGTIDKALEYGGQFEAPSTAKDRIIKMPNGMEFCNFKDPFNFVWTITKKSDINE